MSPFHNGHLSQNFLITCLASLGSYFILHNSLLMRVIAIDPSLRSTGYAILEKANGKIRSLEYGLIRNRQDLLHSSCLVAIRDRLRS